MLIGEEAINSAFNTWLKKNHFEARIRGLENDFFWGADTDTIAYSFVHTETVANDLTQVFQDLGLAYDMDIFWLSFFHELGHSRTWHLIDDNDIWEAELLSGFDYYYCQREIVATEWAVNFINKHFDLVQELMEMTKPAILYFFNINKIEMEE